MPPVHLKNKKPDQTVREALEALLDALDREIV
jgi:hypothetical protein